MKNIFMTIAALTLVASAFVHAEHHEALMQKANRKKAENAALHKQIQKAHKQIEANERERVQLEAAAESAKADSKTKTWKSGTTSRRPMMGSQESSM